MTTHTEEILRCVGEISKTSKLRGRGKYTAGHATFDSRDFDGVIKRINRAINPLLKNGEKIENDINTGSITDCGLKQFEILKGKFFEVYDYDSTTAIFIRLYHVKGETEWLALYVDENPNTPWWGEDE